MKKLTFSLFSSALNIYFAVVVYSYWCELKEAGGNTGMGMQPV